MDDMVAGDDGATPRVDPGRVDPGARLRAAREAAGLSLADIGTRTRVPLRHLEAIEAGQYQLLPSTTYAVGFARAYARALDLDDAGIAADVRAALARLGPRAPDYEPYEIPDPARVPSRGLAVLAAGFALALVVLVGLWFGTDLLRRSGAPPAPRTAAAPAAPGELTGAGSLVPAATPAPTAPAASPTPAPVTGGQVRLAAASSEVWLRVYDADNKTLYLGTMQPGDGFDVPADARGPRINVGRPDKLAVTLNGRAVPPLGDGRRPLKDVAVDAAAIAARLNAPAPAPTAVAAAAPRAAATRAADAAPRPRPRPKPTLSETQRANLDSARAERAAERAPDR